MENSLFIKIEIVILLLSSIYVLYYMWAKLYYAFFRLKNKVKPVKIQNKKTALNKVVLNKKNKNWKKKKVLKIWEEDKQKIIDILKRVKMNSSKWYFDTAKLLIVEWLSLDKHNRELNLELAIIYEKEKNYINAEYIYKDLLEVLNVDFEIMKKLGYIFAMQNKLKESFKIYETIHNKKMADDEVIDLLSELAFNMKLHKKSLKYINLFLVAKPRNVEKLFMKAECLENLWKEEEWLLVYKRILDLQPYNTKAKENIERINESKYIA